jgi:hypothetical protein
MVAESKEERFSPDKSVDITQKHKAINVRHLFASLGGLFTHLNDAFYAKPMDPSWAPKSEEKEYNQLARLQDRRFSLFEPVGSIENPNHGFVHHMRKALYISAIIRYYQVYGTRDLKGALSSFSENDILKLMICMAYSRIARKSEISHSAQPNVHKGYCEESGRLFQQEYDAYKREKALGEVSVKWAPFSYFDSDEEFQHYKICLIALGDPNNEDPLHVIMNTAHKLDLYRCFDAKKVESYTEKYLRQHSDAGSDYGLAMDSMIEYASRVIKSTGDRCYKDGVEHFSECLFVMHNQFKTFHESIVPEPFPTLEAVEGDVAPRLIKSIDCSDDSDFLDAFLDDVLRTGPDGQATFNTERYGDIRVGEHKRYIWKNRMDEFGEPYFACVDTYKDQPSNPPHLKKNSKPQPWTYIDPKKAFCPNHFWGSDEFSKEASVGVEAMLDEAYPSRIYSQDAGTTDRKDQSNAPTAEPIAELSKRLDDLLMDSGRLKNHEVIARVNNISAIIIFKDNLKSRLLAQVRARNYQKRIKALYRHLGLPVTEETGKIPIKFYTSGVSKKEGPFQVYDEREQIADFEKAKSLPCFDMVCRRYHSKTLEERLGLKEAHKQASLGNLDYFRGTVDNIDAKDTHGKTPLHYAAQGGHIDLVLLLLEKAAAVVDDEFKKKVLKEERSLDGMSASYDVVDRENPMCDNYFTSMLRIGRYDYAMEFLERMQEMPPESRIPIPLSTDQIIRILKPKNYAVIMKLIKLDYIDFSVLSLAALTKTLNYLVRMSKGEFLTESILAPLNDSVKRSLFAFSCLECPDRFLEWCTLFKAGDIDFSHFPDKIQTYFIKKIMMHDDVISLDQFGDLSQSVIFHIIKPYYECNQLAKIENFIAKLNPEVRCDACRFQRHGGGGSEHLRTGKLAYTRGIYAACEFIEMLYRYKLFNLIDQVYVSDTVGRIKIFQRFLLTGKKEMAFDLLKTWFLPQAYTYDKALLLNAFIGMSEFNDLCALVIPDEATDCTHLRAQLIVSAVNNGERYGQEDDYRLPNQLLELYGDAVAFSRLKACEFIKLLKFAYKTENGALFDTIVHSLHPFQGDSSQSLMVILHTLADVPDRGKNDEALEGALVVKILEEQDSIDEILVSASPSQMACLTKFCFKNNKEVLLQKLIHLLKPFQQDAVTCTDAVIAILSECAGESQHCRAFYQDLIETISEYSKPAESKSEAVIAAVAQGIFKGNEGSMAANTLRFEAPDLPSGIRPGMKPLLNLS